MIDIFSLSVEEMASKIKEGHLSSVEVCKIYIERISKFEKDIKAWAHFDKKVLLEKAADADEHRKSGKPIGLLHGIPIALKDIIGTVDMPTECGTSIRKGKSYSQNAEIVELLEIFKGIMPFLGIVIFGMFLMYMFPGIALWLPDVLFAD